MSLYLFGAWRWFTRLPAVVHVVIIVGCMALLAVYALWFLILIVGVFVALFLGGMCSAALEIWGDRRRAAREARVARQAVARVHF